MVVEVSLLRDMLRGGGVGHAGDFSEDAISFIDSTTNGGCDAKQKTEK
jgi:hypothetical protein